MHRRARRRVRVLVRRQPRLRVPRHRLHVPGRRQPRRRHEGDGMSRRVVLALRARGERRVTPTTAGDDGDPRRPTSAIRAIGAELGVAIGGRVTRGGLRLAGHYLYQLIGSGLVRRHRGVHVRRRRARRASAIAWTAFLCDHGLADGGSVEVGANVRRFLRRQRRLLAVRARRRRRRDRALLGDDERHRLRDPAARRRRRARRGRDGVAIIGEGDARARVRRVQSLARRSSRRSASRSPRAPNSGCEARGCCSRCDGVRQARSQKPAPTRRRSRSASPTGQDPVGARVLLFDAKGQPVHFGAHRLYGERQGADGVLDRAERRRHWDGIILADGTGEVRSASTRACLAGDPVRPLSRVGVARHRVRAVGRRRRPPREARARSRSTSRSSARGRRTARSPRISTFTRTRRTTRRCRTRSASSRRSRRASRSSALSDHNANGDLDAEITRSRSTIGSRRSRSTS